MATKKWDDLGNGQWQLTILDEAGAMVGKPYKGTREQITDKLADSRVEANRFISKLRNGKPVNFSGPIHGDTPPPPPAGPRPLSTTERMQIAADITNPATVDKAVTRVVESVIGPVAEFQQDRAADREERAERSAVAATNAFLAQTPEWLRTPHNNQLLVNYMKVNRLDNTKVESYLTAFEALTAAGLLQTQALEDETPPEESGNRTERTAPTPKPNSSTRFSTSIRSSDISGRAPEPNRVPRLKYTREQLNNLSAGEYKRLMQTDGVELSRCENYYAKNPARRAG